jgi:hypothetical protein
MDGTNDNQSEPEFKPTTKAELQRRAVCKKRYGRAGLTIRRWGGWGEFVGEGDLAEKIDSYREKQAGAEDVAWAFIHTRVAGHSPTFSWDEADLRRLLVLVAECSRDPLLQAREPEGLAAELVAAQSKEREHLQKIGQQIGASLERSVTSVNTLARAALTPQLTQLAASQARTLDSISKALAPPLAGQMRTATHDLPTLRASKTLAKALIGLPNLRATEALFAMPAHRVSPAVPKGLRVSALPKTGFLAASLRLPDNQYRELSRSLGALGRSYQPTVLPSILEQLVGKQSFQIGEILRAARSTAAVVEREGRADEAEALKAIVAEAEGLIETPSLEKLAHAIEELGKHFDERLEEEGKRRHRQRKEDQSFQLYLCLVAIYFSFYIALYFYLLSVTHPTP